MWEVKLEGRKLTLVLSSGRVTMFPPLLLGKSRVLRLLLLLSAHHTSNQKS